MLLSFNVGDYAYVCPKPHEEVPKIYFEIAQKASGARRDEKLSEGVHIVR